MEDRCTGRSVVLNALLPKGEVHTDWILCSKAMLPACGLEEETDSNPDHVAIKMEFQLDLVSQGYMGPKIYETGQKTTLWR
eukprot:1883857-Amphidinium_carterae.1